MSQILYLHIQLKEPINMESTADKFYRLHIAWKMETMFSSNMNEILLNLNYLKIIAMGNDALQFIHDDLKDDGGHWGVALEAITEHTPQDKPYMNHSEASEYWIKWLDENS